MGQGKSKSSSKGPSPVAVAPRAPAPSLGPGWDALSQAQQSEMMKMWRIVAGSAESISKFQFEDLLLKGGMTPEDARLAIAAYDMDGDGFIDLAEFQTFSALSMKGSDEDKMKASFLVFDADHNGILSRDELKGKIRSVIKGKKVAPGFAGVLDTEVDEVCDKIFDLIDTDKSGGIDMEEFVAGFLGNAEVLAALQAATDYLHNKGPKPSSDATTTTSVQSPPA